MSGEYREEVGNRHAAHQPCEICQDLFVERLAWKEAAHLWAAWALSLDPEVRKDVEYAANHLDEIMTEVDDAKLLVQFVQEVRSLDESVEAIGEHRSPVDVLHQGPCGLLPDDFEDGWAPIHAGGPSTGPLGPRRCVGTALTGERCKAFASPWVWKAVCFTHADYRQKASTGGWHRSQAVKDGKHLFLLIQEEPLGEWVLSCENCYTKVALGEYLSRTHDWLGEFIDMLDEAPVCAGA